MKLIYLGEELDSTKEKELYLKLKEKFESV